MKITPYTLPLSGLQAPLRAALVSDLHEADPAPVLEALQKIQPQLILIAGDTMEQGPYHAGEAMPDKPVGLKRFRDPVANLFYHSVGSVNRRVLRLFGNTTGIKNGNSYRFLEAASQLAPICLSSGNHDWRWYPEDFDLFQRLGITLLDNSDCTVTTPAGDLQIGGLSTFYDLDWLRDFVQKPGIKLLLCHHPEYYVNLIRDTELDQMDYVLSGHTHGGQWRIGTRGVLVPGQGIFAKCGYGHHGKLVVGAGVSNTLAVPRLGNPREVVQLNFIPAD